MRNTTHRRRERHALRRRLAAALVATCSLFAWSLLVHSQDSQKMQGKTKTVVLLPNQTVDAGEIKFKADSDHDGMPDEAEAENGTDPQDPADADFDADSDGLTNGDEVALGSKVNNADTDGDSISDGVEAQLGFDPGDANSKPPATGTLVRLEVSPASISISLNSLLGQQPARLRVRGVFSDGSTTDLTEADSTAYNSLNESVAIVDDVGTVAGLRPGATAINVTSGGQSAQVAVTITAFTPGGLSSLALPGTARAVAVAGNYAYVAAGVAGLQVVDVSNRAAPFVAGALDTPGEARDVAVAGGVAYVADGAGGLRAIDVSAPSSPAQLGFIDTPGDAQGVVVYSGRAYVADGSGGLAIIDVNDPASPRAAGTFATAAAARAVDVSAGFALVATAAPAGTDAGTVEVIDVTNPAAPHLAGSVAAQGDPADLIARDRFAYVASSVRGMRVVDFSTPGRPVVVQNDGGFFNMTGVAAFGRYAFFAAAPFDFGSPVYDLDDPSRPRSTGQLNFAQPTGYAGTGIAVDAAHVYTTAYSDVAGAGGRASRLFIGRYQEPQPDPVDAGRVAPTVSLTAPSNGDMTTEGAWLTVTAAASDDVQVAAVRFVANGVPVAPDIVAPFEFNYIVPVNALSVTLSAVAFDFAGNSSESPPVTLSVDADPPPVVEIWSPVEGEQLTQGLTAEISAFASDNGSITKMEYFVNGTPAQDLRLSSGSVTINVPLDISELTLEARATDDLGRTGSATRTYAVVPYTGPVTTVTGRVFDGPGLPAHGLTVSVHDLFTTQVAPDGTYTLPNVPTVRFPLRPKISGRFNGRSVFTLLDEKFPVEGGVTDFGNLILTPRRTLLLSDVPRTVAAGGIIPGYQDSFLVGFGHGNRLLYPGGVNEGQHGAIIDWGGHLLPPSAGVKSASVAVGHLYAQLAGQPGTVTDSTYFTVPPFVEPRTVSLQSGLIGESDYMAAASEIVGGQLKVVLAFLQTARDETPSQTAALSVRFGNGQGAFGPPVELPVAPDARLRTLKLHDINGDGLAELLLIREGADADARLVVYPRVAAGQFGAPVESPVAVRTAPAAHQTYDYTVNVLDAGGATSVAILGDDRVRIYTANADGAFALSGELTFPEGIVPAGIESSPYRKNSPTFSDSSGVLVVSTAAAASPTSRALRVFVNPGDGFRPPGVYDYTLPTDPGKGVARVFAAFLDTTPRRRPGSDIVIIEGGYVTALYGVTFGL